MTPENFNNPEEFAKEFQKFLAQLEAQLKEAAERMKKEIQVTQVLEGQHGKYLIHLN